MHIQVNPLYLELLSNMSLEEVQKEIEKIESEISELLISRALYNSTHWTEAPYWSELEKEMVRKKNWEYFLSASIAISKHWTSLQSMLWAAKDHRWKISN